MKCVYGSHAEDLFPRERDMTFSYISSRLPGQSKVFSTNKQVDFRLSGRDLLAGNYFCYG